MGLLVAVILLLAFSTNALKLNGRYFYRYKYVKKNQSYRYVQYKKEVRTLCGTEALHGVLLKIHCAAFLNEIFHTVINKHFWLLLSDLLRNLLV